MKKNFILLFLCTLFLSKLHYAAEFRRIYDNDKPNKNGKHHWYYTYKMNPSVLLLDEVQTALQALNDGLEHNHHKKLSVSETESEIVVTISELDPSNSNCGDVAELPLKKISMPKFPVALDIPATKSFYKKLFIKRLQEASRKAQKIKAYDYFSFEEKMAYNWNHEIKPAIQSQLAQHCANEIAEIITDHYLPSPYTPTPITVLIHEHNENAKRAESLNTLAQALVPLLEAASNKNKTKKQTREFKSTYLNALDAVHEDLIHE